MQIKNLDSELTFRNTHSSGKGGQHVNKVATKVELRFDVQNSSILTEGEKLRLYEILGSRISNEGVLRLSCQETRSQIRNKEEVIRRFYTLLEKALAPKKVRIPVKKPKSLNEKRLSEKKKTAEKKNLRQKISPDEVL
ncbi:MAG: aminoacyl-tRNA hydrolase [Bacteroidetes bacterium]|nr:aminoacyl-tRNA hydrolase [Bacteroidota bacterium]